MRYIIFILLLITLSGCSISKDATPSDEILLENTQNDMDNLNNEQAIVQNNEQPPAVNPYEFEDLVAKYSGAVMRTNFGDIKLKFYNQESPNTVNNFLNLVKLGFYDGTKFHRVIPEFMIQGGDPNSKDDDWLNDGRGGPGYQFDDEINEHKIVQGSLAMANSGPGTNGSQFFIVTTLETPWLDGKHTNFGFVESGLDIALQIEKIATDANDHPLEDVEILGIDLVE